MTGNKEIFAGNVQGWLSCTSCGRHHPSNSGFGRKWVVEAPSKLPGENYLWGNYLWDAALWGFWNKGKARATLGQKNWSESHLEQVFVQLSWEKNVSERRFISIPFYTHFIIAAFYLFYIDLWALRQNRGVRKKAINESRKNPPA